MNKMQLLAIALGIAFLVSLVPAPVVAAPAAQKVVAVECGSIDYYADYANFVQKLSDWGFTVKKLFNNNATYDLTGVDAVVLPMMNENLTTANMAQIQTWWNIGGKSLWVASDSDYAGVGGFGALAAHRPNDVLETIGSHLYFEQTSIESTNNDGAQGSSGYRASGGVYATTGDAATLCANMLSNKTIFHGPTCIIAKNSTNGYVDIGGAGVTADVQWVVKTVNSSNTLWSIAKNATTAVAPYRIHKYGLKQEFVLMGLEKFTNGNKLVVTGENIFSSYKNMFGIPCEKYTTILGSDVTLVYNTMMYFASKTQERAAPTAYEMDVTIVNSTTGLCLFEWKTFDGWTDPSGVCGAKFLINNTVKRIVTRTNLLVDKMTLQLVGNTTAGGVSDSIVNATAYTAIPIDYAGNVGTYDADFVVPDKPVVTTTPTKPTPGFELPLMIFAMVAVVAISRRNS